MMTDAAKREARLWGYLWNLRGTQRSIWRKVFGLHRRFKRSLHGVTFHIP